MLPRWNVDIATNTANSSTTTTMMSFRVAPSVKRIDFHVD